jgi:hypothetical protein
LKLLGVLHVVWFLPNESLSFIRQSETSKQEAFNGIAEVAILGLLTVFVHDISHNVEINVLFHDKLVVFGVSVGEQNHNSMVM